MEVHIWDKKIAEKYMYMYLDVIIKDKYILKSIFTPKKVCEKDTF